MWWLRQNKNTPKIDSQIHLAQSENRPQRASKPSITPFFTTYRREFEFNTLITIYKKSFKKHKKDFLKIPPITYFKQPPNLKTCWFISKSLILNIKPNRSYRTDLLPLSLKIQNMLNKKRPINVFSSSTTNQILKVQGQHLQLWKCNIATAVSVANVQLNT